MPIGVPRVPFRLPGEEEAVWVDVGIASTVNIGSFLTNAGSKLLSVPLMVQKRSFRR